MTLTPDKIELAQRIADALEEGIGASHRLYGSTYKKSDCCKILIKPLLGNNQIDALLEALSSHSGNSLRERYSRLTSCFDTAGELLDKNLPLTTVQRYVKDLIQELRNVGQGSKRKNKRRSKQKRNKSESTPIAERFSSKQSQVLFDSRDLNVGTGAILDIAKALIENFGHVVPFKQLDEYSPEKEASEQVRTAIRRIRKKIESENIPVVIENRKGEGYIMLPLAG